MIDSLFVPMILGADFIGRYGIRVTCAASNPIVANINEPNPKWEQNITTNKSRMAGEPEAKNDL